ncbi:MAG: hypothetical protein ACOC05_09475, partial [Oceanicaulis sp.]
QKAVFSYDAPTDTQGRHVLTMLPPRGQGVDIAAVAIRAVGSGEDLPAADGDAMQNEAAPQSERGGMDGEGPQ